MLISGLIEGLSRYPFAVCFLIAAAVVNAVAIQQEDDYTKYFLTFLVGAFLGFTFQAVWERFFDKKTYRRFLMGFCLLATMGYFLIVRQYTSTSMETWIRTSVALFALLIAYVWVPTIKSEISFNESFMATFKAVFNALLFSGVLFIGITLIITAIDLLLFRVSEKANLHTLNIVGIIFAPIYFFSLIPIYPGVADRKRSEEKQLLHREKMEKSCQCPKFLEVLLSYVIIPLLLVYTVILVIYIARNITGKFWTDNRLEPMLVGFAIAVILIYILVSNLHNKFADWFCKIFPKVLIPIVLFQIVASVLRIQVDGVTYGRYYVIIFGIFALISGVLMSFLPVRKNGIIAALLIGFSIFSIIPPVDAFTISRINQVGRLTETLVKNDMLENQKVTASSSLSQEDKLIISNTVNYLVMMEYTKGVPYLGEKFDVYEDFYDTFGFYRYEENPYGQDSIYLNLNQQSPIDVSDFDIFVVENWYSNDEIAKQNNPETDFEKDGNSFILRKELTPKPGSLSLIGETGEKLLEINMKDVFEHFDTSKGGVYQINKDSMSSEEATVTFENERAIISFVAVFLGIEKTGQDPLYNGDFYVFVKIK
jgi:hypothetical protein